MVTTMPSAPRPSYRTFMDKHGGPKAIVRIHRTSDKALPGEIVLPGNGSRPSYVVSK